MRNRNKILLAVIVLIMLTILMIPDIGFSNTFSQEQNSQTQDIVIKSDTKINDDVFEVTRYFKNEGIIVGDLFIMARKVYNHGIVKGDILGMSIYTYISGKIKGNVRVFTKKLCITDEVYKNVTALTRELVLDEAGVVDGSITVFGNTVQIDGLLCSDIRGKIDTLVITGEIKGDVNIEVENIIFGKNGKINGNLNYKNKTEITMPRSHVHGEINYIKKDSLFNNLNIKQKIKIILTIKQTIDFYRLLSKCI